MIEGVKIEGMDELVKAFAELGTEELIKLREPVTQAANIVIAKAKPKIHDVTGELKSSLKVTKPSGKGKNKYQIIAKVGIGKAKHAVPLELGHRLFYFGKKTLLDVEPKPFLRPAAEESKEEVFGLVSGAMQKILDEMGGLK